MADVTLSSILSSGFPYRKHVVITTSQTWTLPSTAAATVDYDLIGGGAAGSSCSKTDTRYYGNGGNGGRRIRGTVTLAPGTAYPVVIGAGGIGTSDVGTVSGGGDTSAFGITAAGGNPPKLSPSGTGYGGSAGDASPLLAVSVGIVGASGMDGVCSGGGGSGSGNNSGGSGGAGAGAGAAANPSVGEDATAPGCGGGGACNSTSTTVQKGGAGFRGEVRITYWDSVP